MLGAISDEVPSSQTPPWVISRNLSSNGNTKLVENSCSLQRNAKRQVRPTGFYFSSSRKSQGGEHPDQWIVTLRSLTSKLPCSTR